MKIRYENGQIDTITKKGYDLTPDIIEIIDYENIERVSFTHARPDIIIPEQLGENMTDLTLMFHNSDFNQDISHWDTSKVTCMNNMFYKSKFNQPINDWNVSNVNDMRSMFSYSKFNQPLNNWDVSNVKDMRFMFAYSEFNQPIEDWDVSNVETVEFMFHFAKYNQSLLKWKAQNSLFYLQEFEKLMFDSKPKESDKSIVINVNDQITITIDIKGVN